MIDPRFFWIPPCARSLGADCIAFWEAAGGTLFDWQKFVIEGLLGVDENGQWVSTQDGIDVARQNGKGVILQAVEVFAAFELGYDVVMHTAHEFATSQEHQLRLEGMIQNAPHLHSKVRERGGYRHANGQESINLKSGSRIIFKARTKAGGRGYSGDLLVWDEAMIVPDAVVGAQLPTTRASKAPQGRKTIFAGSAVDQQIHEYGVNFARVRKRGIAQEPRVSYFEWSAPFEDPEQMTYDLLRERSFWAQANPSMADGLIAEETMADEVDSMPMRTVAVELLGVGDWPEVDATASGLFDMRRWSGLQAPLPEAQRVFLAFDVSPLRTWSSISVGAKEGHLIHVGLLERAEGTGWVKDRLIDLHEELRPVKVLCDDRGPAASLGAELENAGIAVEMLNSTDYARACGMFFDAYEQAIIRHDGSVALTSALRGAAQRSLGDAWAWSRKNSPTDITPLVACTLSLFGASTVKPRTKPMVVFA